MTKFRPALLLTTALVAATAAALPATRATAQEVKISRLIDSNNYDPHKTTATAAAEVLFMLSDTLVSIDYDMLTLHPGLAKSWDVSADGLTYTFHLQKAAKWHDGTPFTSADVVFSCDVMLKEVHPRARGSFERCESITAVDDHTVVFKLKAPFAPFLKAFEAGSAPICPKHIFEGTDYRNNPKNAHPIGTGPFMFKEWVKGSHIHLVANPDYYMDGKPGLTEIFFRIVPDAASRSVAMETGEAQLSAWNDVENFDVADRKSVV